LLKSVSKGNYLTTPELVAPAAEHSLRLRVNHLAIFSHPQPVHDQAPAPREPSNLSQRTFWEVGAGPRIHAERPVHLHRGLQRGAEDWDRHDVWRLSVALTEFGHLAIVAAPLTRMILLYLT
jgi:hypothetical protein